VLNKDGTLPDFIVIGALKSATTSLRYYLNIHPQITMSRIKELNFFIHEHNWLKGIEWYKSNFRGRAKVFGEASPNYTNFPFFTEVAKRMYSTMPNVKLLYVIRDPIERMISDYVHHYAEGLESRTISAALTNPEKNPYICRSQYYMQINQYLEYFPKSNILIIKAEDLYHYRIHTLKKVFRFLNVDDSFESYRFFFVWYKSKYRRRKGQFGLRLESSPLFKGIKRLPFEFIGPVEKLLLFPFSYKIEQPFLTKKQLQNLKDFFKKDLESLKKFTGQDFRTWLI
jgi:hypothetical protein